MKIGLPGLSALLMLVATAGWAPPARAQGVPQGSYLGSCTNVDVRGDALVATCRRRDGLEQRSQLHGFRRCAGDIGNNNGVLACTLRNGAQAYGQVIERPGRVQPPYAAPPPVYGEGRRDWREWCRGLRRRAEELNARLYNTWDPNERARLEWRLREVNEQRERCRY